MLYLRRRSMTNPLLIISPSLMHRCGMRVDVRGRSVSERVRPRLVPASGRSESARSSVVHGLRGNRDLHSRWANAVTSCLVITTPFGSTSIPLSVGASLRDTTACNQIPLFCRRIGQAFWTPCNGQANHRQDLDDRTRNVDARAGRQQVARGKVHHRTGRGRSASSVLRSQIFHGFRKPGAPRNLRRSVHAQ
jgi:hypothetical protein